MSKTENTVEDLFVRQLRDGRVAMRALLALARRVRAADSGNDDGVERILLTEYRGLMRDCAALREAHQSLRELVDKATAPPWFVGVYLGLAQTARGALARVACSGTPRLVSFCGDVDPEALRCGDEVLLNEQQNLLVGKIGDAQRDGGSIATVEHVLDDGRLCVRDREMEIVVSAAEALREAPPAVGDRVRCIEAAMLAVETLPRDDEARQFFVEDVGETPPHRLGGMERKRDRIINRYVMHVAHPEVASEYGVDEGNRRLLMEGPPGCGKTLLARVLASAIRRETGRPVRLAVVSGSSLYDPYVGQTERNIAALFDVPPDFEGTTIVFLDEIDAVGRARGGDGNVHGDRFLNTLLAQIEGYASRRDVVVIAATNRAEMLDSALLERFTYRLRVRRPTRAAAREIFGLYLPSSLPLRPNGDAREASRATMIESAVSLLYDENADNRVATLQFRDGKTRDVFARELLSGRLIEQICVAARQAGFERHVGGGERGIALEDVQCAVGEAIDRLGETLSVRNVRSHIADLGTAMDVVRVEPVVRAVRRPQYIEQPVSA